MTQNDIRLQNASPSLRQIFPTCWNKFLFLSQVIADLRVGLLFEVMENESDRGFSVTLIRGGVHT